LVPNFFQHVFALTQLRARSNWLCVLLVKFSAAISAKKPFTSSILSEA